ncbi:MAG: DUF1264 domain-containing protein [Candidatus Eremiobacteraeota bacterium]|nr:DUF1264 domain-containing protein [Candidatus Eremiobacteraeota bacterium]
MKRALVLLSIALLVLAAAIFASNRSHVAASPALSPSAGYTIHIDAIKHFGDAHPDEVAHHYCKQLADMFECQIYDSDSPNAHLVEVETILSESAYNALPASEQALWHYHRTEIPKVNAKIIGMSAAAQQKLVAKLLPTYGKVWMLWDPATNSAPVGQPTVVVLK